MSQSRSTQGSTPDKPALSRRTALAGAGVAGAAAAAAALMPQTPATPAAPAPVAQADDTAAGYRESAHVLHYYRTARV